MGEVKIIIFNKFVLFNWNYLKFDFYHVKKSADKIPKTLLLGFFSFLVFIFISMVGLADEYRDVQASEILKQIENGEDVYLENCRIVGELNLSKIKFETVPNPKYNELLESGLSEETLKLHGIDEDLKIVEINITIHNSIFVSNLDFSNILFKKSPSFVGVNFSSLVYFTNTNFSDTVDFSGATFGNSSNFSGTTFGDSTDFGQSIFGDSTDFWHATFGNSSNFSGTTFGNSTSFILTTFGNFTYFAGAIFGNSVDFSGATFGNSADFSSATFGNSADFFSATFGESTYFPYATFGNSVSFRSATFGGYAFFAYSTFGGFAYFWDATFGGSSNFGSATFKGSVYFSDATFGDFANFESATFADIVDFSDVKFKSVSLNGTDFKEMKISWDSLENSLVFDGSTYVKLISNFRTLEQFEDADAAYYKYRSERQALKSWFSLSKWGDIFMCLTCGYGVRPFNTLLAGAGVVLLFSLFYWGRNGISQSTKNNEVPNQKATLSDAFYFSIITFTTFGNNDWYPKYNFRKWAMLERLLGWLTLSLFLVTLTRVMIRP